MSLHRNSLAAFGASVALLFVMLAGPVDAGAPEVLSVDPTSGPPGTEVSVTGFSSNVCIVNDPSDPLPRILGVVVTFSPLEGPTVDISEPRTMANAGGTIPADAVPGPATLTAYCLEEEPDRVNRFELDSMDFTVTGSPATTTTTVGPTASTTAPDVPAASPRYTG